MNYIGSKKSLLGFLDDSISEVVGEGNFTFCDLFAGTGVVGQHFKRKGYKVIANDLQYYSYVLNKNYIENHKPLQFAGLVGEIESLKSDGLKSLPEKVCDYLSHLKPLEGFIYNNYSQGGTERKDFCRNYFTDVNSKKIDRVRYQIENWKKGEKIEDDEYYFLLCSLLESVDKIANTASVYGAFLKNIKSSAKAELRIRPASFFCNKNEHLVFNEDAQDLVQRVETDILYLDPPYNQRQYASNYHILETIARYDDPIIRGKTGLRDYTKQKSKFSSKRTVLKSFELLVEKAKARYIFLSYNSEGLMSRKEIRDVLSKKGEYGVFTKKYSRFKSDKDKNRKHKADFVLEHLHYVKCR